MSLRPLRERWRDRDALRLGNKMLQAVVLPGGGHLAELSLSAGPNAGLNCLWAAPWQTADPGDPRTPSLVARYGADPAARFLAGYTGHALCLDLFGAPSQDEAALGIALHGEASVRHWDFELTSTECIGRVDLPAAKLNLERRLSMAPEAPVLFVEERVENRGGHPRNLQWVQHVSLGPPFLAANESLLAASLDRGLNWPLGYQGRDLLRDNATFDWPHTPAASGRHIDLRIPFAHSGTGFVAAARVATDREIAFIAAVNSRLGLALIYCFRRRDFPWIAIWEENCARANEPWQGAAQVRGMEFGTIPMPLGRQAIDAMGPLFDTPCSRLLMPYHTATARYLAAVVNVPAGWRSISDVRLDANGMRLLGEQSDSSIQIAGLSDFLLGENNK